jgi:glycosyltransferase involved in cell wall biosynthesis
MRYVFADDSINYDGYTSTRRALGGPEKAVASLATALQLRGHEVTVINRTTYAHMADGAYYVPFGDGLVPKSADVLIAMRKPSLLGAVRQVKHRFLWVVGATDYLNASANQALWDSFKPTALFVSPMQARTYTGALPNRVLVPGVRSAFFDRPMVPTPGDPFAGLPGPENDAAKPAPTAVVTTHPMHGLTTILDLWESEIFPRVREARLDIYSAMLSKALKGESFPEEVSPIVDQIRQGDTLNINVIEPKADDGMAAAFRAARVHLYPSQATDYACWTLAESQSAGLPAIARAVGGTEERIVNGQTGYLVPDSAALANVAVELLSNEAVYKTLAEAAAQPTRRRPWAEVAAELEAMVASLSAAG